MDRRQREDELRTMLTSQRGKEELLEILKKHAGMEGGNLPPFGSLLVQAVLNYEFPPGRGGGSSPGRPPARSEPREDRTRRRQVLGAPGREAPGG